MSELDRWLEQGEVAEADWTAHVVKLAAKGDLGRATAKILVDLPALTQRHACVPLECTPGKRAPRTRSCCADIEVELSREERVRILAALPEVAARQASRDPRWAKGPPTVLAEGALSRPGRRCVFAEDGPEGLRCALHRLEDETGRPRGALKPIPCRLFPVVVVDLGDDRLLLTALHRRTGRLCDAGAPRSFPCLRDDPARPRLYEEMRSTIEELLGKRAYKGLAASAKAWLEG